MGQPNVYWAGTSNYTSGNFGIVALFPHWTCGGFDGSVATLQNPDRQASAHYVIEGTKVAQLVSESDSAWHCGNYYYNMRAISYELVGWAGNPPSYETLDTCARMMAQASRDYFGGAKLVLGDNVMLHKWVSSTDCPGETDIDWLVNRANMYLNGGGNDLKPVNNEGAKVYRVYNPNGFHHYAASEAEKNMLVDAGWQYEGIAWEAPACARYPVYRMYNPGNGDHMYTANYQEAEGLAKAGWDYECVPYFVNGTGKEIYRVYNPNSGEHFFTADKAEAEQLGRSGWSFEGVAFKL